MTREITNTEITVVRAGEGERVGALGESLTIKAELEGFGFAELTLMPGSQNPLHDHAAYELFYVLEGTAELGMIVDGRPTTWRAGPGDTIVAPGGVPHSLHNPGDVPTRMLIVYRHEMGTFFRDLSAQFGHVPGDRPPTEEEIGGVIGLATSHGMTIYGPHPKGA